MQDHISFSSHPPLPEDRELHEESALENEGPETVEGRDEDEIEGSEQTRSTSLSPLLCKLIRERSARK
jgi:hypothetical protein